MRAVPEAVCILPFRSLSKPPAVPAAEFRTSGAWPQEAQSLLHRRESVPSPRVLERSLSLRRAPDSTEEDFMQVGESLRVMLFASMLFGSGARQIAAAQGAATQDRGRITATALDAGTRRPLAMAQVFIPGTRLGGVTDERGQLTLANVPVGQTQVSTRLIGYTPVTRAVTVVAGQTVTIEFLLAAGVTSLNEVVVTGTAGQARRREVGNSIAQIKLDQAAPTASAEQVLQGQAAGVTVMESGAQVGSGRQIRLRGSVSVAMSNQPLIYVDGVRMRSDMMPQNMLAADAASGGMTTTSGSGPGTVASPLNSIDPQDIERIEVIKGAAATTLYGTEAAAGVIQIFTKKGRAGSASWNAAIDQGISELRQAFGTPEKKLMGLDPWLTRGWSQNYSMAVNGGSPDMGYYVSGGFNQNQGIVPDDWEKGVNVRGNFNFRPTPKMTLDWNTTIVKKNTQNAPMGNNAEGLTLNVYRLPRNYIGSEKKEDIDRLFEQEWITNLDHMISGVTLRHQPTEKLNQRFTIGLERLGSEMIGTLPYGFITDAGGMRSNRRWQSETFTMDYVATLESTLPKAVTSRLSLGAQSVNTAVSSIWGHSEDFPGPGDPTLSSGALTRSFEERQRVINAGLFGEELLGYKDRYFLTLGVRADGNSAFGQNLGLEIYPKVSASYVLSEEPFFPKSFGTWKLRAAYGHAGRAPGAFDAVRTWRPAGWAGQSAFLPRTVGNPNLGPERTAEFEAGFDATLLDERLSLVFSYYTGTTSDALLPVTQMPSLGFTGTQLENVGTIKNKGVEITANAMLISRENFGWNFGVNYAHNRNKLVALGGSAPFLVGETGWVIEGQPVPVIVGTRIMNPDELAEPVLEANHYFGPNVPPVTIGLNSTFTLPHKVELSGVAEYMGGSFIFDRASRNMASRGVWAPCQGADGGYAKLAAGRRSEMTAFERITCNPTATPRDLMNFPADFFKLRHVTVKVPVSARVLPGTRSASLSASLRNIRLWKNPLLPIFDPEMAGASGAGSPVRAIVENIPTPTTLLFSLRMGF
jgi:TonB-dependent SusC/RagA subfamily outer membrane receptor